MIDNIYNSIISVENLFEAWQEFVRGKKNKKDVAEFSLDLSRNIFDLHNDLKDQIYKHGSYYAFKISDPKPRDIHKAPVRDRLLHHAVYRLLYPYFDKKFVYDSYSCRNYKGTHRAMKRFERFIWKESKSNHRTCWILKCDIKKFFASIDHNTLFRILEKFIVDEKVLLLIKQIVGSFSSTREGVGLPLGNLTSQLLVNIYMNDFDQFMKHILKVKYFVRYADDFVVLDSDKDKLIELIPKIGDFLLEELKLSLHPNKLFIKTIYSGVDFLGWVHFYGHRVLRTTTKRRMLKKLKETQKMEVIQSYLGLLKYGNGKKLEKQIGSLCL